MGHTYSGGWGPASRGIFPVAGSPWTTAAAALSAGRTGADVGRRRSGRCRAVPPPSCHLAASGGRPAGPRVRAWSAGRTAGGSPAPVSVDRARASARRSPLLGSGVAVPGASVTSSSANRWRGRTAVPTPRRCRWTVRSPSSHRAARGRAGRHVCGCGCGCELRQRLSGSRPSLPGAIGPLGCRRGSGSSSVPSIRGCPPSMSRRPPSPHGAVRSIGRGRGCRRTATWLDGVPGGPMGGLVDRPRICRRSESATCPG